MENPPSGSPEQGELFPDPLLGAGLDGMAATIVVMAPVIILFFLAQKAFVEGVTLTGVKG